MKRTFKDFSSNKGNDVCLKICHEEDDHEVTKLSYKQLFKLSSKLIEKNDKIKKYNLYLKDYLKFVEKSNGNAKHEIDDIRNSLGTYETYVLMKKEEIDLH